MNTNHQHSNLKMITMKSMMKDNLVRCFHRKVHPWDHHQDHRHDQGAQSGSLRSPPSFVPAQSQQFGTFAVDPGSIRGCLFRYTYIWMRNRQQFWFYPTFVGRTSVSGWRWTGFNWMFFGVSLRQI